MGEPLTTASQGEDSHSLVPLWPRAWQVPFPGFYTFFSAVLSPMDIKEDVAGGLAMHFYYPAFPLSHGF